MYTKILMFSLIFSMVFISGCIKPGGGDSLVNLEGKKVLFIIAQENFRDEELTRPKKILEDLGAKVIVSSITTDEARGMLGMKILPDVAVRDVNPNDYDALIVVGGSGSPKLADYPEVLNVIRRFDELKKSIGAICLGPTVLAKAGVLNGVLATVYATDWSVSTLERNGATYVDKNVVVDGRIITANGPTSADEFGKKFAEVLGK